MKILLVAYDNDSYISVFPLSLGYIASSCRNAGHEVKIYNQDVYHWPESHLLDLLNKEHFDVVGIGIIGGYYQYRKLLKISEAINKVKKKPNVAIRCLGKMSLERYKKLNCIIATRILHSPMGSFKYKKNPTVPEIGICLDLLSHMVIRKDGKVSICVRFDPYGIGIIGDSVKMPLMNIWNSPKRRKWLKWHIEGKRKKVPFCSYCEFWGVPTGY